MNNIITSEINNAIRVLKEGGVILYPTDTIWGLGCDATNPEAVDKIYSIKQRSHSKSMISLVDSFDMLSSWVGVVPLSLIQEEMRKTTSPLTIIYPGSKGLANNLLAEDGSVAIRITSEEFSNELCKRFGKPIVSTSANISGEAPASTFDEIKDEIKSRADYVVNYSREKREKRKPSSIIKLNTDGTLHKIR